jgi:hypothetical protein
MTRYLWVYSASDEWTVNWHNRLLERRRARGFNVEHFCITPPSLQRRWLPFRELHHRWRSADPALMTMYKELAHKLEDREVLILYNGANLHPDFVESIQGILKVYTAGDDPESTAILTRPIAPAFDVHLINNIACLEMYRSWGLKRVYFWPLGSLSTEEDVNDITSEFVLTQELRPIPIVFFGGRTHLRRERFDQLAAAFPEAYCAGSGWSRGLVDWSTMWATYRQAQIGWNLHNSTGPINFRTYELPAYGIMQICDNKTHLGGIYEIDTEVVGFETIEECIELTRYYLAHPEKQRQIALAGWQRWKCDYTPDRVWDKLVSIVQAHLPSQRTQYQSQPAIAVIETRRRHAPIHRVRSKAINMLKPILHPLKRRLMWK